MNMLSDEILNKYLDGELHDDEYRRVSNQLEFSEEDRKRYLALQAVHNGLKNVKPFNVSTEFTSMFMSKLLKANKAKKEQKIFIYSISSVFITISLVVIGFALSLVLTNTGEASSPHLMDNFISLIREFSGLLVKSFNNQSIPVIGSVISFGIIISAYFFFENIKHSKERLSKIGER